MLLQAFAVIILVSALLAPQWLMARPAAACICGGTNVPATPPPELVLIGEVRAVRTVEVQDDEPWGPRTRYDLSIAVDEYLQGRGPREITVQNFFSDCSVFDEEPLGDLFVLRLRRGPEGELVTSKCVSSQLTETGDELAARIDRIRAEIPESVESPGFDERQPPGVAERLALAGLLATAVAAAGAFAALVWRGLRSA
jgi:hypothetical protein